MKPLLLILTYVRDRLNTFDLFPPVPHMEGAISDFLIASVDCITQDVQHSAVRSTCSDSGRFLGVSEHPLGGGGSMLYSQDCRRHNDALCSRATDHTAGWLGLCSDIDLHCKAGRLAPPVRRPSRLFGGKTPEGEQCELGGIESDAMAIGGVFSFTQGGTADQHPLSSGCSRIQ